MHLCAICHNDNDTLFIWLWPLRSDMFAQPALPPKSVLPIGAKLNNESHMNASCFPIIVISKYWITRRNLDIFLKRDKLVRHSMLLVWNSHTSLSTKFLDALVATDPLTDEHEPAKMTYKDTHTNTLFKRFRAKQCHDRYLLHYHCNVCWMPCFINKSNGAYCSTKKIFHSLGVRVE